MSLVDDESRTTESEPIRLLTRATCPHCWETFAPEQVLWISEHVELLGDPMLGPERQQRFLPSRFTVDGDAIDARGMTCRSLACPHCHLAVPRAMLEMEPLFLSILGSPASGKSFFLTTMTWQLRQVLPMHFRVAFTDADPTSNRMLNSWEESLFLNPDEARAIPLGNLIRKTELQGELYDTVAYGQQAVSYPRPFLFALRPQKGHSHADSSRLSRMLCLYDNAGEHFQPGQDTASSPVTRHLARSRAVMFLFDPTQDPRFRTACRPGGEGWRSASAARLSRQETILNEAAARIRRHAGMPHTGTYDRPLVVVLSKLDEWNHLLDTESGGDPWRTQGNITGVDMDRVEHLSGLLRPSCCTTAPRRSPPPRPSPRRHLHRRQLARPARPARPRHRAARHPPRRDPAHLGHRPPALLHLAGVLPPHPSVRQAHPAGMKAVCPENALAGASQRDRLLLPPRGLDPERAEVESSTTRPIACRSRRDRTASRPAPVPAVRRALAGVEMLEVRSLLTSAAVIEWSMVPQIADDPLHSNEPDLPNTHAYVNPPDGYGVLLDASHSAGIQPTTTFAWTVTNSSGFSASLSGEDPSISLQQGPYTVQLTATALQGSGGPQITTTQIQVKDVLIVSIGDSIASGEGNPVVPSVFDPQWAYSPDPAMNTENANAHRSTISGPAQFALQLQEANPQEAVTFVSVADSAPRSPGPARPDAEHRRLVLSAPGPDQ